MFCFTSCLRVSIDRSHLASKVAHRFCLSFLSLVSASSVAEDNPIYPDDPSPVFACLRNHDRFDVMIPPSDSINHHNLKLAEFVSSLRNQTPMAAPPPPYAARPTGLTNEELLGQIEDVDDDACTLASVVIKIDTSIHVEGHANTVAIPSSSPPSSEESQQAAAMANAPPTPTSATHLQQLQQQRQTKSSQLATTIITALRSAGALEDAETGRQRPIEVNVNAGIRIKGNGNVVCAGVRRSASAAGSSNAASERKRRATSVSFLFSEISLGCADRLMIDLQVPLEQPVPKKFSR